MNATTPKVGAPSRPARICDAAGYNQPFNAIIYGSPGAGKTTLAATAPGPILFLDCDQGLSSLRNLTPEFIAQVGLTPTKDLYSEPITDLASMMRQINRIREDCQREAGFWRTVVLDNLTELQRVLMTDILKKNERIVPQLQDHGVILIQMQGIVRALRNLPVNTIFIAHERTHEGGIEPALSGRIAEELPGYVDLMARLTLIETEVEGPKGKVIKTIRKLRCRQQLGLNPVRAKCRSNALDDWEVPHLGQLIDKTQSVPKTMP